ncbi:MAG TPA: UDP-N-acetylglucosamine 2-epimerase (non-hydrolyzing) [Thermoanaerobaculia bacterium]|nr:UDP-N-acetylglucosamine 2-epimerase (non-hydrolyzing) [Thermoanaerobaculia bacterium]
MKVLVVVGTRPEAIKMAPVVLRLRAEPGFETVVCATAQHRDLLDSALALFGIAPDVDLDLMRPNQTPSAVAAGVLSAFDAVLEKAAPDVVLVQGDTTTVMAASLACFHRGVRVGHVEAGLRTANLRNPFPEEMNRRVTDLVSSLHFAPTARSASALAAEGVDPESVHVTGNTVVDALRWLAERSPADEEDARDLVLVTSHRRESFGAPMRRSFRAIARLARRFPETRFVFPVHPNPNVLEAARAFDGIGNVELLPPVDYARLVSWMRRAKIILTDSGGIQEEAPTFGKPTLVLRETTERPEGIEAGVAKLVGTDEETIYREAERLLSDPDALAAMSRAANPYGDGRAAERIVAVLAGRPIAPFSARA